MLQPPLGGRDLAGGDLVFVGREGCQDFVLLAFWDLEEIQGPSEFRCNLIEFFGGDPEVSVGFLKAERRRTGLGGPELKGPTGNVADPQRPHELEAGQPAEVLGVPLPQLRVLGLLADDGVLHDVAEVIHHRRDGEDAAQPFVQTFLRHGLVGLRVIRPRQHNHGGSRWIAANTSLSIWSALDLDGRNTWMFGDQEAKAWSVEYLWDAGLRIVGSRSFHDIGRLVADLHRSAQALS